MGVDPAVLDKAGIRFDDTQWTWKDFENYALTIYQKTGIKTMPFDQYIQLIGHLVREYGYHMYSDDQKSLAWSDNPQIIADWLDINLRLKAAGALYDPEEAFITVTMEEYQLSTGKTWNAYYWSNQHIGWQNAAKRPLKYVMNPTIGPQRKMYGTYLKPSQFISVLSTSANKDLAAKFVNFFVNDKEANGILLAERGIPAPQDVRDYLAPMVDPAMKTLFDYITHVTPYTSPIDPPEPAGAGEVRDAFKPIILQCLTGKISSIDAARQMIAAGNAILSR
jgi:multiple sugar transport system substrate-binding protein